MPAFLDPETLPIELRTLLEQVQTRIGREVWLIDVTTDLGVSSTLAYSPGPRGRYLRGYGASLSRRYSVYRALTELLEVQLTDRGVAQRLEGIELLKDHPVLQACAELDLRPLAASTRLVPYAETAAPCLSNGITVVHVHIPGLERFHMIVDGPAAVVPGRRGIAAVELTAPACPV
ncbi:hypothetical protein A4G29_05420 [Mycobacterium kansasii]|nr:hypothetical protein A4G29_05420 [Mycobacterium kansasii]